jgi:hypothetical protein
MADGLFNLAGRRVVTLQKDGREYRMAVRSLGEYALKEAAILRRVGNPYAGIDSIRDAATRQAAIKAAADAASRPLIATLQDEEEFNHSMGGVGWGVWRALSLHHPDEFPPDATIEKGIQLGLDFVSWFGNINGIMEALHAVEEKTILGNSGPPKDQSK